LKVKSLTDKLCNMLAILKLKQSLPIKGKLTLQEG